MKNESKEGVREGEMWVGERRRRRVRGNLGKRDEESSNGRWEMTEGEERGGAGSDTGR